MAKNIDRWAFKSGVEYYIRQLLKNPINATLPDVLQKAGFRNPEFLEKMLKKGIISRKESIKSDGAEQFQILYHVNDAPEEKIRQFFDEMVLKESVFKNEDEMKKAILADKKSGKDYKKRGGIKEATSCGGAMGSGSFLSDGSSSEDGSNPDAGTYVAPIGNVMRRTLYITEKQAQTLRKKLLEEEGEEGTSTFSVGGSNGYGYDVPAFADSPKKGSNDEFFADANDHSDIMAKSWNEGK